MVHAIGLSSLDRPPLLELDPSILERNLKALRRIDPTLADGIAAVDIPPDWTPARALDGFATWRIADPTEPPHWLEHTALPLRRARAYAAGARPDQGVALPGIGTGAEPIAMMDRIGPLAAVFVFEPSVVQLAAVLRTSDLALAIESMRCILIPEDRTEAFLRDLLDEHPGLLPPARLIPLPGAIQERMEIVHGLCDRVGRDVLAARETRLRAIAAAAHPAELPAGVAILCLQADPRGLVLARDLERGAARCGVEVRSCLADGPRRAHTLAHAALLEGFAPRVTICVDHPPAAAPFALPGVLCQWHTRPIEDRGDQLASDVIHLAATPTIAEELAKAGVLAAQRTNFFFGTKDRAADDAESIDEASSQSIVLIADLPSDRPEAYGVVQPTHKILWQALGKVAASQWTTPEMARPDAILRRAERQCRVEIKEATLRARLLRIIGRGLIPAVVLERMVQEVAQLELDCAVVGTGWHRIEVPPLTRLAQSARDLTETQWNARPVAAIFAGAADPLRASLPATAARGWPILLHAPDPDRTRRALGGVLEPGQYLPFSNARELAAHVREALGAPASAAQRAKRTAERLQSRHAYSVRIRDLLAWIDARDGGNA